MKRTLIALAAATAIGVAGFAATQSFAHGPGGTAGPGWGYGMMNGYGPGNGAGYGPGMTRGYGPGMTRGYGPGNGAGYGPGMTRGYGPGMMRGYGYGPGYGHMGYGPGAMMGYGPQGAPCPAWGDADDEHDPLTLDQARQRVEQQLKWMGNDHLKLGKIEAKGDNAYVATIVTTDGSLVDTISIDRTTGYMRPVR